MDILNTDMLMNFYLHIVFIGYRLALEMSVMFDFMGLVFTGEGLIVSRANFLAKIKLKENRSTNVKANLVMDQFWGRCIICDSIHTYSMHLQKKSR